MDYPADCIRNAEYSKIIADNIFQRIALIEDIFLAIQEKGFFNNAIINRALLYTAVSSYYTDIERIKCFHPIPFTDQHKKAAFSIKWLIKLRPIQLVSDCDDDKAETKHVLINEFFAVFVALALLDMDFSKVPLPTTKYLTNLIYTLFYREVNGMVLSSVMYLLECGIKNEVP